MLMIAFGIAIGNEEKYERWALRGIGLVAEEDSVVLVRRNHSSIQEPYNSILDEAATLPGLEAVVLIHDDTEISDPRLLTKIRNGFADPSTAVMGPIGGTETSSIAWWEGKTFGRVAAPNVTLEQMVYAQVGYGWHEVDAVDGLMMVLSPWAAREVRFDERLARHFHGYDVDYCFQVRSRGHRCVVAPLHAIHYGTWKPERGDQWVQAHIAWQRKWGAGEILPRPPVLAYM
jgi:hypothetical protein